MHSEVFQSPVICTEEMNSQVVFNMADSDCDLDHRLQKALDILAERGFKRSLREEQKISIRQLWFGGDLLAVLQTGYGKSLIFQLLVLSRNAGCALVICERSVALSIINGYFCRIFSGDQSQRRGTGKVPAVIRIGRRCACERLPSVAQEREKCISPEFC